MRRDQSSNTDLGELLIRGASLLGIALAIIATIGVGVMALVHFVRVGAL